MRAVLASFSTRRAMPAAAGVTWQRAATGRRRRASGSVWAARMPNGPTSERIEVTRTYLELARSSAREAHVAWPAGITLAHEQSCSVALARALYAAVGRAHHWYDRDA